RISTASAIASGESIIDPRTDSSASRFWGGTRGSGRARRRTVSVVPTTDIPSRPDRNPTCDATLRRLSQAGDNPGGLSNRWSPPELSCHSAPHQPFPHVHNPGENCESHG